MSTVTRSLELADRASIHFGDDGEGGTLVLLHGGLSSRTDWVPVAALLSGAHRVLTPDSRGHGQSTNPAGSLSYATIADDIAALITKLGIQSPVLGGWSDGGQVVLEVAVRHPGLAKALIVGAAYPEFDRSGLRETHRGLLGADQAGNPNLASLEGALGSFGPQLQAQHAGGIDGWRELVQQTAGMWLDYPGRPLEEFANVDTPALVVAGDRDELISFELSRALYQTLPNAELVVLPGLTHEGPSLERAKLFAAVIDDFARRQFETRPTTRGEQDAH